MGLGIAVHLVDEAVEQLESGMEVEQVGLAGVGLLVLGAQPTHLGLQALFIGGQLQRQAQRVRVGQGAAHVGFKQRDQGVQAGLDGADDLQWATCAQAFEQPVQGVEARGDGHEFAVHAHQPARAPAHVRVFEGGDVTQALQAHGLGNEAHVAGFETVTLAVATQGFDHHPGKHAEALVQGVAHGRAGRLRQNRGADKG
ncbi:hypothetical protein D3C76_889950 [compost metagenome]